MTISLLRPNEDVTNNWTKSSGAQGFACIDDAVTQPTDAEASGDGNSISGTLTSGTVQLCGVGTVTIGLGLVKKVTLWVHCKTGTIHGFKMSLFSGAEELGAGKTIAASTAKGWQSFVYEGPLTQAQIDALRIRLATTTSGAGEEPVVYAAYLEVEVEHITPGYFVKREGEWIEL